MISAMSEYDMKLEEDPIVNRESAHSILLLLLQIL
jgi:hypothetical protein